jgi:alpha-D-xyloside xylohydrolase
MASIATQASVAPAGAASAVHDAPVASFDKISDGIVVTLSQGAALRLQVFGPRVIHVSYNVGPKFADSRVPVVIAKPSQTPFQIQSDNAFVTLSTKEVAVHVDRKTGALRFTDASGKILLAESSDGRSLTPTTLPMLDGGSKMSFQSVDHFLLPADEAVYGLGQHQEGYLDYRGSTVTLEQNNREVGIPFLISSRGYGLLWNNAAHTNIAVGTTGAIISPDVLSDDTGKPGGLTAQYYKGRNFDTLVATRTDQQVDFKWDDTPPQGLPHDDYSVRWTGSIQADKAGDYQFATSGDDGIRLWIDGKQIVDDWSIHAVKEDSATVHFDANSRHTIRMEFFQGGGGSEVHLKWSKPGAPSFVTWTSEAADDIDYYLFAGPKLDQVLADYRNATGNAPLPPKWALGYWQSKERYNTQQELLDIAAEYRKRNDPIDNIVQDWYYWDPFPWGSHKFDPKRYPDPAAAVAALHDQDHMHIMISVWGMFAPGSPTNPSASYDALNAKGYLYPPAVRSDSQFYDAFNPAARDLYWQLMRDAIYKKGFDAWWLDASEPEVNMQAFRKAETAAGPGALVLNAWPLMHTTAVSEGQLRDAPDKRVYILTRSAYAGQQRTGAATWSGDITATWNVFANQIPAGLNISLSGIPYWTTDIGGFFVNYPRGSDNPEYRELYTRWFQFGAFCPIFRSHGTNTPREMWRFGSDTEKVLLKYDNLRYRLMPYIYSQAWQVTSNGAAIMRPLVMDFPGDAKARECKDQFLFGPSMMACPVIKAGATTRDVYLPAGASWTDFWTGKSYRGGSTVTSDAPIDTMPLFIRNGSIVPMGPYLQYVSEKPADPIELRVYPGANGAFTLYEDDGENREYLKGQYATIPITWDDKRKALTIGDRSGSYAGMLAQRTFHVVFVKPGTGGVETVATPDKTVTYSGKAVTVRE